MNLHRTDLAGIEQLLMDESLYTDSGRKEEMTQLLLQAIRSEVLAGDARVGMAGSQ